MNKNALVLGLAGTLLVASWMPINVDAQEPVAVDTVEVSVEDIAEQEIMTLSLDEAKEYALKNSLDMKIQDIELQKSTVSYEQNIRAIKAAEKAQDIDIPGPRTYEVTADYNVNQALIKNGASRKSVELAFQVAKRNKEMKINEIKYNVEKAYFDLLRMKKELSISEENRALSQKQYDQGMKKFDVGTISQQQLLGLEMGLLQAQNVYDSTKMYLDLQLMSFQNTMGLSFDQQINLTDTIEYKVYEPIDLAASIKQALENNNGIKTVKESYEISELTLKAVKGRYPEITYRYREQEAEVAKSAKNLETARNGVEMGVRSSYLNLLTAEKQIKTYEKTIEQVQKAVKIAELSFELGQNTSVDVTQAYINLMNAKKNLSQQIHAFNMALLDYEYSIGIGKGF